MILFGKSRFGENLIKNTNVVLVVTQKDAPVGRKKILTPCEVKSVESCAVSLLTNSMSVEGTASAQSIIQTVEKAGYGAKISGSEKTSKPEEQELLLENSELKNLKSRLVSSLIFLLILMYFSMGLFY